MYGRQSGWDCLLHKRPRKYPESLARWLSQMPQEQKQVSRFLPRICSKHTSSVGSWNLLCTGGLHDSYSTLPGAAVPHGSSATWDSNVTSTPKKSRLFRRPFPNNWHWQLEPEVHAGARNLRFEVDCVGENIGREWNGGRESRQIGAGDG